MKSLNEDIKTGNFKQMYLICGEESYLKKQYKDRMSKAIVSTDDTMNYGYYEGKNINTKEIIDIAETMPFFGDRRLIVIENSGFFKNKTEDLAEYLGDVPETTYFLFIEDEIDKRSRIYKTVQKKGRVVEMKQQDERTLMTWIHSNLKKEDKKMEQRTIHYLLSKVGTDMDTIAGELEKLICYTWGRDMITQEDIDEICVTQVTNQIFDMVEAVGAKRQKEALNYYYELLALKEPAMRILFLLSRHFNLLLQVKSLSTKGYANKDIASKVGVPPFAVQKYATQAKNFKTKELKAIIEDAVNTEEAVKTGNLSDRMSVELFIVKYSMA